MAEFNKAVKYISHVAFKEVRTRLARRLFVRYERLTVALYAMVIVKLTDLCQRSGCKKKGYRVGMGSTISRSDCLKGSSAE